MSTTTTLHVTTTKHPPHTVATTRTFLVPIRLEHCKLVVLSRSVTRFSRVGDLFTSGTYSNVTARTRKAGSSRQFREFTVDPTFDPTNLPPQVSPQHVSTSGWLWRHGATASVKFVKVRGELSHVGILRKFCRNILEPDHPFGGLPVFDALSSKRCFVYKVTSAMLLLKLGHDSRKLLFQ